MGMHPAGETVDIYYYPSGHIALYLDAFMLCSSQSHLLGSELALYIKFCYFGFRLCVVLQENIACARTSQPHYTTAIRIEVSSSLY